jgi:hypothetical protein
MVYRLQPGEVCFVGMDEALAALVEQTHGAVTVEYLGVQMNRGPWVREFRRVRMPADAEALAQLLKDYQRIVDEWNRAHPKAAPDATGRPLNWCITEHRWADDFEAGGWVRIITRRLADEIREATASLVAEGLARLADEAASHPPAPPQIAIPPELRAHATPKSASVQLSLFDLS